MEVPQKRDYTLSPPQFLVVGFAFTILIGTCLLMLPLATVSGQDTRFIDALFTATSAVCVTGLTTVTTAAHWTVFGQVIILLLIQIGGLGIMTMSVMFALLTGRRISLKGRILLQEALGQFSLAGLVRLTRYILLTTLVVEGVGALLLTVKLSAYMPLGKALYFGIFHSISAFCNAGFDLFGNSLENFVGDVSINLIIALLIILGGLGFFVLSEVFHERSHRWRLSLHSKMVLKVTAVLIFCGWLFIFFSEYNNHATLGVLSLRGKIIAALFHSITPRTAGFNTLQTGLLLPQTLFFTIILMYIGASPGGTGGGIKTTTFATILAAVKATISGNNEVTVGQRRLSRDIIDRAIAIGMLSLTLLTVIIILMCYTEKADFLSILFEATSAFGTVGLSMGITPLLTYTGKLAIIITMFSGRVGPLTLAMAIAQRQLAAKPLRHPEEKVLIG